MYGLKKNEHKKKAEERDANNVIQYQVVEEVLNRDQAELDNLTAQYPEPTNEELLAFGRAMHPYYSQADNSARIAELQRLLAIET